MPELTELKSYLVTVEGADRTIVAGIYVLARSVDDAKWQVKVYLEKCSLKVWPRSNAT